MKTGSTPSAKEQVAWLKSRSTHLIEATELEERITKGPIEVKFGVDPTTPHLHLGHMVPVWVLKKLQEWGHHITIVIGDFTAFIGDPSGQQTERPPLLKKDIEMNLINYRDQVGKVLSLERTNFQKNSQWLEKLKPSALMNYFRHVSLSAATQREDFKKRERVTLAEVAYSTLVGIDSLEMQPNPDLEIGGQDQLLNLAASRELMRACGRTPESIFTTPLLRGTTNDNRKMSKSYGNAINVEDAPDDMFGKVMSVPDVFLGDYFNLATDLPESEWKALVNSKPRDAKLLLAKTIVTIYHNQDSAAAASRSWVETFSQHHTPADIPTYSPKAGLKDFTGLLVDAKMAKSRTEALRLLRGGAVEQLDGPGAPQILTEKSQLPNATSVYKIGKRRFVRIVVE